jgi:hypothetical protein
VGGGFLVVADELWFYFSARTLQKPLDGVFPMAWPSSGAMAFIPWTQEPPKEHCKRPP